MSLDDEVRMVISPWAIQSAGVGSDGGGSDFGLMMEQWGFNDFGMMEQWGFNGYGMREQWGFKVFRV